MSISSALIALQQDITNARAAIVSSGGTVTSGGGFSQLATDIATINPLDYTVDFYSDNQIFQRVGVNSGKSISKPCTPSKTDCLFLDWVEDLTVGVPIVFPYTPTSNKTFYAYFIEAQVPAEYQQVEYIESTGTQYIKTGITTWNNTLEYAIKLTIREQASGTHNYFGAYPQWSTSSWSVPHIGTYTNYRMTTSFQAGYSASAGTSVGIQADQTGIITLVGDKITWDQGNAINFNRGNSFTANREITLFCMNGSEFASFPMYYAIFWLDNELVASFIPCYRKSDSVAGMYDVVNNTFHTNAGSGEFVVGPALT